MVTVSDTQPAPLRRDRSRGVLGGVCAGIGRRLGIDPLILRIGFVAAAAAGGTGVILYAICWALLPATGEGRSRGTLLARAIGRRESWMVASGLVLLMLALLLLFRAWGVWVGDAIIWPLILATGGGALIWRQSQATVVEPAEPARAGPAWIGARVDGTGAARAADLAAVAGHRRARRRADRRRGARLPLAQRRAGPGPRRAARGAGRDDGAWR